MRSDRETYRLLYGTRQGVTFTSLKRERGRSHFLACASGWCVSNSTSYGVIRYIRCSPQSVAQRGLAALNCAAVMVLTVPFAIPRQFTQSAGSWLPSSTTMAIHQMFGFIDDEQKRVLASPRPTMMPPRCPPLATGELQALCQGLGWVRNMPLTP